MQKIKYKGIDLIVYKDGRVKKAAYDVVDTRGRHYHFDETEIKFYPDRGGYMQGVVSYKGKYVALKQHRIVAIAFIPNPNNLPDVNHKDENKANNRANNLEWCDQKYNTNYGTALKRMVATQKANRKKSTSVAFLKKRKDN